MRQAIGQLLSTHDWSNMYRVFRHRELMMSHLGCLPIGTSWKEHRIVCLISREANQPKVKAVPIYFPTSLVPFDFWYFNDHGKLLPEGGGERGQIIIIYHLESPLLPVWAAVKLWYPLRTSFGVESVDILRYKPMNFPQFLELCKSKMASIRLSGWKLWPSNIISCPVPLPVCSAVNKISILNRSTVTYGVEADILWSVVSYSRFSRNAGTSYDKQISTVCNVIVEFLCNFCNFFIWPFACGNV